jgi:hypothetical protein
MFQLPERQIQRTTENYSIELLLGVSECVVCVRACVRACACVLWAVFSPSKQIQRKRIPLYYVPNLYC